ncbi:hypothetical protein FRC07_005740 [Ceratobasidium sp. 392]|nr:hypothetical protein FRC07_005740 [Ceratobasidium sp. 392]
MHIRDKAKETIPHNIIYKQASLLEAASTELKSLNYEVVNNYRQFIVQVSLSQTDFGGSYRLKLNLAIGENEFEIGSVAVLGRGRSAGCGNCQGLRAIGARVHGVVLIPHEAVVGLVQSLPSAAHAASADDDAPELEDVAQKVLSSLRPSIVLPSGKVVSRPSTELEVTDATLKLPAGAVPSIHLLSGGVYQPLSSEKPADTDAKLTWLKAEVKKSPFGFYDWKDHGAPLLGEWVKQSQH